MSELPSKKQHELLEFIGAFIKEHEYAPSYREVMRALDYKSVSTVAKHIDGLIERGWLVKRDNSARSVEVVYKAGNLHSPTPPLPSEPITWLTGKIDELIAGYIKEPTPELLSDLEIIIESLRVLEQFEAHEQYKQKLETLASLREENRIS